MKSHLSQDYDIDNRSAQTQAEIPGSGPIKATDNESGKRYLKRYIEEKRRVEAITNASDESTEGRFVVAGPENSVYGFRNGFRASK
jgi:hypothetical protein